MVIVCNALGRLVANYVIALESAREPGMAGWKVMAQWQDTGCVYTSAISRPIEEIERVVMIKSGMHHFTAAGE